MGQYTMRYQGTRWDAPAFDEAVEQKLVGFPCIMCDEAIEADDNACLTPVGQFYHLECFLRPALGSVAHLEGQCACHGGSGEKEYASYREGARATLQWLIDHNRGRFVA